MGAVVILVNSTEHFVVYLNRNTSLHHDVVRTKCGQWPLASRASGSLSYL